MCLFDRLVPGQTSDHADVIHRDRAPALRSNIPRDDPEVQLRRNEAIPQRLYSTANAIKPRGTCNLASRAGRPDGPDLHHASRHDLILPHTPGAVVHPLRRSEIQSRAPLVNFSRRQLLPG